MGIRVNKAVGYGLCNLAVKKSKHGTKCIDPRLVISRDGDEGHRGWGIHAAKFLAWIQQPEIKARLIKLSDSESMRDGELQWVLLKMALEDMAARGSTWELGRSFVHQTEFGLPSVLLVIPPDMYADSLRHDTVLDWAEETTVHQSRSRVLDLNRAGLYPHDGVWKRIRPAAPGVTKFLSTTGEHNYGKQKWRDEDGALFIDAQAYNFLVGRWDKKSAPEAAGPMREHLLQDYRPPAPMGVLAVLLWFEKYFPLGLQPILDDLRTLLYVWWC